jgi:hypothetical protein
VYRSLKGGGVSFVVQPLQAHQLAYEAEEYHAMNEYTTGIDIVPLPTGEDVLTAGLRDGARRMLAQGIGKLKRGRGWFHKSKAF